MKFSQNEVTNSYRAGSDLSQDRNVLVSSALDAISAVLSLESTDPSSDVEGFLAIDVFSVRKKWRKMKERHHVPSESQSHVILLFEGKVSSVLSLALFGPAKAFHGCKQTPYITWPAQSLRPQQAEDVLMRHIRCENRGAPEQGAKCRGESWAALWEAALGSHSPPNCLSSVQERPSKVHHSWTFVSENHLLSFSASHSHRKKRKSFSKSSLNLAFLQKDPPAKNYISGFLSLMTQLGTLWVVIFFVFRRKLWQQAETSLAKLYIVGSFLNNSFQQVLGLY